MPDAILKQVITNWESRIVNDGVDMNDDHWTVDGLEESRRQQHHRQVPSPRRRLHGRALR
jgi:hypothetical protein